MPKKDLITLIKKLFEPAKLTRKGKISFGDLDKSFSVHGTEGLKDQITDILIHTTWPKKFKANKKSLETFAEKGEF
jgi:hypothetical protein